VETRTVSVYRVKTSVTGVFTSMDLALDGKRILLSYDGDQTYTSTDQLDLSGVLKLQWIGFGLSFQDWTIALLVSVRNPDGSFEPEKKWSTNGTIPPEGGSQLYKEIDLTKLEPSK
jgi:hypothetical protein